MKICFVLLSTFLTINTGFAQVPKSNAYWMSGNWGLGTILGTGSNNTGFDVDGFIDQVSQIQGPSHILLNLTKNANGDRYTSPHSILELMGPNAAPATGGIDILMEIAEKLDSLGLRLMVYVATEGPAKLKGPNSYKKAHDYDPVTMTSQFVDNWVSYVLDSIYVNEPGTDNEKLKRAFAEIVIDEYAERFGDLIDVWWFDHAVHGDIPRLESVIKSHNPHAAIAFNTGQKVPLTNNSPGYEDLTFGHVTPVSHFPPTDSINLPMITSIEDSTNNTGYFGSPPSLGHIALPAQERWFIGDYLWDEVQARNWMSRTLCAKGSLTWTVKQQSGSGFIDTTLVSFLQNVAGDCASIPSGNLISNPIAISTLNGDTLLADSNYTNYQWYENNTILEGETNQFLSNPVIGGKYSVRGTHLNGCASKSNVFTNLPTSIKDIENKQIALYPNPVTTDKVYLKGLEFEYLQIHSINGTLLLSQEFSQGREINVANLEPGVFVVSFFKNNRKIVCEKLIKM